MRGSFQAESTNLFPQTTANRNPMLFAVPLSVNQRRSAGEFFAVARQSALNKPTDRKVLAVAERFRLAGMVAFQWVQIRLADITLLKPGVQRDSAIKQLIGSLKTCEQTADPFRDVRPVARLCLANYLLRQNPKDPDARVYLTRVAVPGLPDTIRKAVPEIGQSTKDDAFADQLRRPMERLRTSENLGTHHKSVQRL